MKGKMRLALLLLLLCSDPSQARDLWVAAADGGYYAVMRGHLPARPEPYNPPCIQNCPLSTKKGCRWR